MARVTKAAKREFLQAVSAGMSDSKAAIAVGLGSSRQIARHRTTGEPVYDPEFAAAYTEAKEQGNDAIRDEIHRRGVNGVEEPVFYRGEVVGHLRRYSDTLLMALANSRLPEFREVYARSRGDQPATPEVTHGLDLSALTEDERDALRALVAKARPPLSAVA